MLSDQWFVVTTNPRRESFVAEQLDDFDPYLPVFKTSKGNIAPVFPSYLFVPATPQWSPICNTVGVRALLMSSDRPACISGIVIAEWRAKERGGLVQLPPPPRFKVGQRLTITAGSLKYRSVVYQGMSGRDRERVLIEMLGQQCTVTVATEDLVAEFHRPARRGFHLRRRRETFTAEDSRRFA